MTLTFNDIPQIVAELFADVKELKALLKEQTTKVEPQPNKLTLDRAVTYLNGKGFPMTKSKLYKLTATNEVPVQRFGNRLVFDASELWDWCTRQTKSPDMGCTALKSVSESANRKLTKTFL
jgi:hypothetical protein